MNWNGPRPKSIAWAQCWARTTLAPSLEKPGLIFYQARQGPIPDSCTKMIFYEVSLVKLVPKVKYSYSWKGPRREPVSPGAILGPHYTSRKPDEAGARVGLITQHKAYLQKSKG